VAQLIDTINEMIDTLAVFADQVTTLPVKWVWTEDLGGQASVSGRSGIWKNLTEERKPVSRKLNYTGTCYLRSGFCGYKR
jgi:hypothetical protein